MTSSHFDRKKGDNNVFFGCCTITLIVSSILLVLFFHNLYENDNQNIELNTTTTMIANTTDVLWDTTCVATKITYPTNLPVPYFDKENTENYWTPCHCGTNCTSWIPKITIFGKTIRLNSSMNNKIVHDVNFTVFDSICKKSQGFSKEYFQNIIEEFNNTINNYTNKTFECVINIFDNELKYWNRSRFEIFNKNEKEKEEEEKKNSRDNLDFNSIIGDEDLLIIPIPIIVVIIFGVIFLCWLFSLYKCCN